MFADGAGAGSARRRDEPRSREKGLRREREAAAAADRDETCCRSSLPNSDLFRDVLLLDAMVELPLHVGIIYSGHLCCTCAVCDVRCAL